MKAFLDTEATGTKDTQVAQLSYIITDDELNVVVTKNFFFTVKTMNPFALRLHGLSLKKLDQLSEGRTFADHIDEIEEDLSPCQLVCHNYRSDHDMLAMEFQRLDRKFSVASKFCTMDHFRPVCVIADKDGKSKNPSLKELISYFAIDDEEISDCTAKLFGLDNSSSHDSRYDAAALFLVCKTALDQDDYYCSQIPIAAPAPPGQIVSLNEQRRRKAQRERALREKEAKRKAPIKVPHGAWEAPYAKYLLPFLALLIVISIILRVI